MLDSTGDTASHVQVGMDGLTGLTNLTVLLDPAAVNADTRGGNLAAQLLGQSAQGLITSSAYTL